jgi:superfamily II DNA/RNA helicase
MMMILQVGWCARLAQGLRPLAVVRHRSSSAGVSTTLCRSLDLKSYCWRSKDDDWHRHNHKSAKRTTPSWNISSQSAPSTGGTRLYSSRTSSGEDEALLPRLSDSLSSSVPDQSAAAQSRPAFSMPKKSPDDSQLATKATAGNDTLSWHHLGLWTELIACLESEMQLPGPTVVQQMVLPPLLQLGRPSASLNAKKTENKHVAFLAATGSGKTLAYALPVMQLLKQDEVFGSSTNTNVNNNVTAMPTTIRPKQRPRAIVLAPTRELCLQITKVFKQLSHHIKLSVASLTGGGEGMGTQRKLLESKAVDVVVATPGRLYRHVQAGSIVLSAKHLRYVVLDEMDTMLEQGFASDLQHLLYPLLFHQRPSPNLKIDVDRDVVPDAPSVILTSATMTQTIQKMIGDNDKDRLVNAKKHYSKPEAAAATLTDPKKLAVAAASAKQQLPPMVLPRMKVYKAPGLHKTVPRLQQVFVDTAAVDKISLLIDLLSSHNRQKANDDSLTMVFCNTASSCRAVEFALAEAGLADQVRSYHGELNSAMRTEHLQQFRDGTVNILVCTDLAARGLDIPAVDHVVMFDFPLNALDYLHRSGRTARGSRLSSRPGNGKVTALVAKRDQVLANAIAQAVQRGEPLDGLSSRKTDYLPGGRLNTVAVAARKSNRSATGVRKSATRVRATTTTGPKKVKPKDTTMRKKRATSR